MHGTLSSDLFFSMNLDSRCNHSEHSNWLLRDYVSISSIVTANNGAVFIER